MGARLGYVTESKLVYMFVPGHWGRNLIRDPPSAAELSQLFDDFEQSFLDGQPFEFTGVACEFAS